MITPAPKMHTYQGTMNRGSGLTLTLDTYTTSKLFNTAAILLLFAGTSAM